MRRRNFLTGLGMGSYSLMVMADKLQPASSDPPTREELRNHFDALAPDAGFHTLAAEPHMRVVDLETDVLVAGGGLAGVCAAIAAARHGARVVLVQDRSRLGGNSSSEVKMHVVGANSGRSGWREGGLIEEFRLADAVNNPQRSFEMWDLMLYDKVVSERNITLLLDSALYSARKKGDHIEEALVRSDKTEHIYRIKAKMFCDCTGDCRLALETGAELRSGREAKSEFGEPLGAEKADNGTLGSSILFTARHYDRPMPFTPPAWARKVTRDTLRMRKITAWEYGYWWIAWGGDKDLIHDNERVRFELMSIVMGVWDYIKNSDEFPSSAAWALDWVGMIPGKRGSRRMAGDHILTQHDLMRGDIEDAVAIGGWPMDDHPPAGFDREDLKPNIAVKTPDVYNIPLRSLYSKNIGNLLMAGRNISCSHVAFTSTRVMATCAAVGQAVGTAAAMCLDKGITPRGIYEKKPALKELQQTLLRDDQTIRGRVNEDPRDLARSAQVKASSELPEAPAVKILDGHVRDLPDKEAFEIHHWAGLLEENGAWIELKWPGPQRIREVQITFDTGFQRVLTLTAQDSYDKGIIRAPQPETVRDYSVSVGKAGGQLQKVAGVKGNFQRIRRHRFDPVETDTVRVHLTATNGDKAARIFEIRCYS